MKDAIQPFKIKTKSGEVRVEELKKPQPNKNEVGKALERALNYSQKAEGFASVIAKLQPHLTNRIA